MNLRCPRGCDRSLSTVSHGGVAVLFCDLCRMTFCRGKEVARWLGRELTTSPSTYEAFLGVPGNHATALMCPQTDGQLEPVSPMLAGAYRCTGCGGVLVEAGVLPRLRAWLATPNNAASAPAPPPEPPTLVSYEPMGEHALRGARAEFHHPWVDLFALPTAFFVSWLFLLTTLGRMLAYPLQIQFHELGHAVFSWLSARAALPLPFGFTFWREEKSVFTGLCMLFLLGVLGYRSYREARKFPLMLALGLTLAFVWLALVASNDTSRMFMLAGGLIGELVFPSLCLVAFYFPMPDRFRWDFFRFVMLGPATAAWLASATMWFDVARGSRPLPMGSILGAPGDGSGDLERLIDGFGFTPASITRLYLHVSIATALLLIAVYGFFATKALKNLLARVTAAPG